MKKIPTLFRRNWQGDKLVRNELTPGTEWVRLNQGIASPMYDGHAYKIRGVEAYKRYILAPMETPPPGFEPADDPDINTAKLPGWVPVDIDSDQALVEAIKVDLKWTGECFAEVARWADGTYELCGPGINGNPEGYEVPMFVPHGYGWLLAFPRTFDAIKAAFSDKHWYFQGVVWRHEDGRMAKIKVTDFGLPRHPLR